jgi:hypothetical protein
MSRMSQRAPSFRGENEVRQKGTAYNGDTTTMRLRIRTLIGVFVAASMLFGCGEPKYEHESNRNSVTEDRRACAVEVANSPAAQAYRQNPAAHRDYPSQAFADMIRCIERNGWKQVGAKRESQQVSNADVSSQMGSATRTIVAVTLPGS